MTRITIASFTALTILAAGAAYGQSAISAKSGMIHYTEGEVYLAEKRITPKRTEFPRVDEGQTLRTGEGRVEVLLTPGVFLRLSEESEIRVVSASLDDTKIELLAGSALVEAGEVMKNQPITVLCAGTSIELRKRGLVQIDAKAGMVRSYDGQAVLVKNGETLTLKEGREAALNDSVLTAAKFKKDETDGFYRWASRRSGYLSAANLSAAKGILDNGIGWSRSGWLFNPYLGLYTFVPFGRSYWSPFGYGFYSPRQVAGVYYQIQNPVRIDPVNPIDAGFGGGSRSAGYYGGGRSMSGGGYSGGSVSAAPAAPSASAPAAGPRGGDSGGGRGGNSGR